MIIMNLHFYKTTRPAWLIVATKAETTEILPTEPIIKRVNTTNPIAISDEDRRAVRSDVGNNMTKELHYITTAKHRTETKKDRLLSHPDIKR